MSSLRKMIGLDGGEFLDTGLTLEEWMATIELERIRRCFVTQSRVEQQRRLHYTILLAAEGARVRAVDNFGSAVVEMAVEHVMEGDWDGVERAVEWCRFERTFATDDDRSRHYADLWAEFRRLLVEAHAGRDEGVKSPHRH